MGSKVPQPPPFVASNVGETITVNERQLAAAFTEWDRRFREEPERFESEAVHLLKGTPESYGEACAPYLIALLNGKI
jgi:hypothetical protein